MFVLICTCVDVLCDLKAISTDDLIDARQVLALGKVMCSALDQGLKVRFKNAKKCYCTGYAML